jgi:hypothetical protein
MLSMPWGRSHGDCMTPSGWLNYLSLDLDTLRLYSLGYVVINPTLLPASDEQIPLVSGCNVMRLFHGASMLKLSTIPAGKLTLLKLLNYPSSDCCVFDIFEDDILAVNFHSFAKA